MENKVKEIVENECRHVTCLVLSCIRHSFLRSNSDSKVHCSTTAGPSGGQRRAKCPWAGMAGVAVGWRDEEEGSEGLGEASWGTEIEV